MKQFDTVKNNEWVPTEEDLEGAIRVVDALPTASASEEDITYLLNGVMEGYTKTHFYKCVCETIDGVSQYVWEDLNVGRYSVGNCTNIRIMMFDDGTTYRVLFSWKDPEDVEVGSEHIYWKETRLVHQVGHMPVDVNDGVDTFTSTTRDQYSVFGSYSTTIVADGRKHYFKLFPVSEDGAITNDDSNGRAAGYNYVLTTDTTPLYDYDTSTATKTYYFRSINTTTGNYEYTACTWDSNCFDGGGTSESPWTFKSDKIYYEYQNAFIDWLGIRDLIQNGEAPNYFPVGSILVLPYHGDFGEMSFEVVDYDTVQPADSSVEHTMTLQSKYLNRWWDYSGGVVFDTNERGGAKTADSSRNTDKVYFKRLTSTTQTTASEAIAAVEGTNAIYVETIFDETRKDYHTSGSWSNGYYECELPYRTLHLNNPVSSFIAARSTSGTATTCWFPSEVPFITRASTGVVDTTLYDETNYRFLVAANSDAYDNLVFQQGITYWKKTGTTYTALTAVTQHSTRSNVKYLLGETIRGWLQTYHSSGYTIWASASSVSQFGLTASNSSNAATYYNTTTTGSMYHPTSADAAWGGYYTELRGGYGSPRSNGYAEYFTPCIAFNSSESVRGFNSDVKYYIPTEYITSRTRSHAASKAVTYYTWRQAYLRCITGELYSMYQWLAEVAHTAAAAADADRCAHVNNVSGYTDTSSSSSNWSMSVENILKDKICIPTGDERYQAGKNYFKADYSLAETGGKTKWGYLYFSKSGSGTVVAPSVFKRMYYPNNVTILDDTYVVNYTKLVEGTDYNVGDLIPQQNTVTCGSTTTLVGTAVPYFVMKKQAIADAVEITDETETFSTDPFTLYIKSDNGKLTYTPLVIKSANDATSYIVGNSIATWRAATSVAATMKVYKCEKAYIWTLGNQADGEYVKCTQDFRDFSPYSNASTDTIDPLYAPSNQTLTTSNTSGVNYVYRNNGIFESTIGPIYKPVPEDSTKVTTGTYYLKGGTTYQKTGIACTSAAGSITFTAASGTYLADMLYFTYDGTTYTLKTDYTVGDTISDANIFTVAINIQNDTTVRTWKETAAVKAVLANVEGLGFREVACGSYYQSPFFYAETTTNGLYWKTPNTERVAYGNHVWAQSNIRMYFNGPMDSTQEYMHCQDGMFRRGTDTSKTYAYYKNTGGTYVKLVEGTVNTSNTYVVGTTITAWEEMTGFKVYTRFIGGTPVGYKLDINRPDKYNDFGLSPVMQYTYDNVLNQWVPKYSAGNCWWSETVLSTDTNGDAGVAGEPLGRPSINNGLIYDRLATMYWSNCILGGTTGDTPVKTLSPMLERSGGSRDQSSPEGGVYYGGYSKDAMKINGETFTGKNYNADSSAGARTVYCYEALPRQSFLHGFLDCKYKRSSDVTYDNSKDYYLKNPYGGYDKLDANDPFILGGPYAHVLYELNNDYMTDLKEAKNFLDGIIPVVNHNGCYGTTGAYDMYPQTGSNYPNLGGTTTIDKVWLASTSQVNGGTGDNNGIYENPSSTSGSSATVSHILSRYINCTNNDRVKKGLTLGAHGTSGYADAMAGAQYWWLRSAGGNGKCSRKDVAMYGTTVGYTSGGGQGYIADEYYAEHHVPNGLGYGVLPWLSPLITLG